MGLYGLGVFGLRGLGFRIWGLIIPNGKVQVGTFVRMLCDDTV